ncbi:MULTISPECIES: 3,4-dihydroxy-2-butanone-4-phosphate synthase [unclassified Novosphingobium]|uniref:3,4-dihydroxy-2-butanone-4-phosphate synthase n=1 Tax=unclassified Novosphingobium TaxID=2644732 RepID=UPI001358DFC4|nr:MULTISPECIES: 3,4-dihydroxy-2-butanone-4-phosphate synthase [unclassified Novosphingobium]
MQETQVPRIIASAEEIIEEARQGRMFILVDDEDRENEGDLVIPAQMVTPEKVNFMATHGRGLICLALSRQRGEALGLKPMSPSNGAQYETAFTVSIEAREGVTTGISAADRSRTITTAIDARTGADDIVTPGHVFPLIARDGGVLVRAGHTEAAVDVARLAGLNPSGVICEIMNEDGTMARLDDLFGLARLHELKIGTIRDLIHYRRRFDKVVEPVDRSVLHSDFGGEFAVTVYRSRIDGVESLVLQKGDVASGEPVLVRMHGSLPLYDLLGMSGPRSRLLQRCMEEIAREGRGVIVLVRTGASDMFSRAIAAGDHVSEMELRHYGTGAQILADLGVQKMVLLTTLHRHIVGLEGFGLEVVGERQLSAAS